MDIVKKVKEYIYNPKNTERHILIVTLTKEERSTIFHDLIGDYYREPIQADRNPWKVTFLDSKNQVHLVVFSNPMLIRYLEGLEVDYLILMERVESIFNKVDLVRSKLRGTDDEN